MKRSIGIGLATVATLGGLAIGGKVAHAADWQTDCSQYTGIDLAECSFAAADGKPYVDTHGWGVANPYPGGKAPAPVRGESVSAPGTVHESVGGAVESVGGGVTGQPVQTIIVDPEPIRFWTF